MGCSLCRRRGRVCSLAAVASALEANSGSLSNGNEQDRTTPSMAMNGSNGNGSASYTMDPGSSSSNNDLAPPPSRHSLHPSPHDTSALSPLRPTYQHRTYAPTPSGSNVPDWHSNEVDELRVRLAEAERRVARTESALADIQVRTERTEREREQEQDRETDRERRIGTANYRRGNGGHAALQSPGSDAFLETAGPLRLAMTMLYTIDETIFSIAGTRLYPHPVMRGIVPASHVELAWHGFKARISTLLPLPPFLAVSTPVPSHGFVLLAALHHVPSAYSSQFAPLLDESILIAMGGGVSLDVILALLILSFAPAQPEDDNGDDGDDRSIPRVVPTALRLISLAYSIGQSLGLDSVVEGTLRLGDRLNLEMYGEALWRLQLWAAVVNRYVLLHMTSGQKAHFPPLVSRRLPILHRDNIETCSRHLRCEAELIEMFFPFNHVMSQLEHIEDSEMDNVHALHRVWNEILQRADNYTRDTSNPPGLRNDARCMLYSAGLRLASLTFWIPSPLRTKREGVIQLLKEFPAIMNRMLDMVCGDGELPTNASSGDSLRFADANGHTGSSNSSTYAGLGPRPPSFTSPTVHHNEVTDPLPILPMYTVMSLCNAIVTLHRSVQFVAAAYGQSDMTEGSRLGLADQRVRRMGKPFKFVLEETTRLMNLSPLYSSGWLLPPEARHAHQPPLMAGEAEQVGGVVGGHGNAVVPAPPATLDFDLLNWDLSLLYPDIVGFHAVGGMQ